MNHALEKIRKESVFTFFKTSLHFSRETKEKKYENLSQDIRGLGWCSNWKPSEYRSEMSPFVPPCLIMAPNVYTSYQPNWLPSSVLQPSKFDSLAQTDCDAWKCAKWSPCRKTCQWFSSRTIAPKILECLQCFRFRAATIRRMWTQWVGLCMQIQSVITVWICTRFTVELTGTVIIVSKQMLRCHFKLGWDLSVPRPSQFKIH